MAASKAQVRPLAIEGDREAFLYGSESFPLSAERFEALFLLCVCCNKLFTISALLTHDCLFWKRLEMHDKV